MRFSTISSFVFASVAALVSAQSSGSTQNAFTAPIAGTVLTAGQPFELKWNNIVGQTVTLSLRNGNVDDLNVQTTIAKDIPNTGSYTWNVPETIVYRSDDTIAIAWGSGGANQINFSARFILNSQFTSGVSTTVSATTTSSGSSTAVSTTTVSTATTSVSTSTSTGSNTTSTGTATTISTSAVKTSTSSSKVTSTSTQSTTSGTNSATVSPTAPTSGTSKLASPLAIVLCLMAAVMYTN